MSAPGSGIAWVVGLLAAVVMASAMAAGRDAQVERAAMLVAQAAPLDATFPALLAKNPSWPLNGFEDKLPAIQLSCMRDKMTRERYLDELRSAVAAFMRAEPEAFARAVAQLDGGTAAVVGRLFMSGVDRGIEREAINGKTVAQATDALNAQEKGQVVDFTMSPAYADARRLVGFDGNLSENAPRLGEELAMKRLGPMLLGAMSECQIPTSILFE